MRATTLLLLVAVVGSTVQAVRIRGSRRKYIVDEPIVNLTPAQKEYFVRLLWLMRNFRNSSDPNIESNDPELLKKLAEGNFYYDDVNETTKDSDATKHSVYHYSGSQGGEIRDLESSHTKSFVRSEGDENSVNNVNHGETEGGNKKEIDDGIKIASNENVDLTPSSLKGQESKEQLNKIVGDKNYIQHASNEIQSLYVVETDSSTGINNIESLHVEQDRDNNSLRNNKLQDSHVVHSSIKTDGNYDTLISNNLAAPYDLYNDKYNSYSRENENYYKDTDPSKSIELTGPYVVQSNEENSYSKENENNDSYRNNEFDNSFATHSDEYSYSVKNKFNKHEDDNEFRNKEILSNGEYKSNSRESYIEKYQNIVNNRERNFQTESSEIQWPSGSLSEEEINYENYLTKVFPDVLPSSDKYEDILDHLNQGSDEQKSSGERSTSYDELDQHVTQPETDTDNHDKFYDDDNQNNEIGEGVEDVRNLNHIYRNKEKYIHKQGTRYKHRHASRQSFRQQLQFSSHLPGFIVKPDLSLETTRIIPAPRLTSFVIKMCDISEPDILEVWRKVAKRLSLDNDYTISNIYEVEQIFKIIKAFVALSKTKNFLRMPLNKILVIIRDIISNEDYSNIRDDSSVEGYEYEDFDDVYDPEENYYPKDGVRHSSDSTDFHVEASLEPVEISSDSITSFLDHIFDSSDDYNSNFLISDESDTKKLSSDDVSNERRNSDDLNIDHEGYRDYAYSASELEDLEEGRQEENNKIKSPFVLESYESIDDIESVLPLDITSSSSTEELPASNVEDNSYIHSSDQWSDEDYSSYRDDHRSENGYKKYTSNIPNSDYKNDHFWSYAEIITEDGKQTDDNLSTDISSDFLSNTASSEASTFSDKKESSSSEDSDDSDDILKHLIPYVIEMELNKFILPFLEKYGHCRDSIHQELTQKLREVLVLLKSAKCF